jgi:hypothetical protein
MCLSEGKIVAARLFAALLLMVIVGTSALKISLALPAIF